MSCDIGEVTESLAVALNVATAQRHHVGGLCIFVNVGYQNDDI